MAEYKSDFELPKDTLYGTFTASYIVSIVSILETMTVS